MGGHAVKYSRRALTYLADQDLAGESCQIELMLFVIMNLDCRRTGYRDGDT